MWNYVGTQPNVLCQRQFAEHRKPSLPLCHDIVFLPLGTRHRLNRRTYDVECPKHALHKAFVLSQLKSETHQSSVRKVHVQFDMINLAATHRQMICRDLPCTRTNFLAAGHSTSFPLLQGWSLSSPMLQCLLSVCSCCHKSTYPRVVIVMISKDWSDFQLRECR